MIVKLSRFLKIFTISAAIAQVPPNQTIDVGNITGSVTLPTGASTEITQQAVLATLSSFAPGGTGTVKIQDGSGNPLTSQLNGTQQALDVGIDVAGVQVDPRTRTWNLTSGADSTTSFQGGSWTTDRTWTLSSPGDSVAATQSGSWTTGRTWSLLNSTDSVNAVQSGSWTVQQGTPPWSVSQSGTWNVGAISGPVALPTGASTEATLSLVNSNVSSIATEISNVTATPGATPPGLAFYNASLVNSAAPSYSDNRAEPLSLTTAGALRVDGSAVTQPVSVSSLPLPAGAATEATLSAFKSANHTDLGTINTTLGSPFQAGGAISNTTFASTQSGTWNQRLQDGAGNQVSSQVSGSQRALDIGINVAGVQVDPRTRTWTLASPGDSVASTQSGAWTTGRTWVLGSGTDSVAAVQSGTWTVQPGNTANTTPWLTTINQGGNSATVTGSNALKVDGSAVTQPVSGTVTANQGGAPWSVSQSGSWTVTSNQGTNPWLTRLTDGTNPVTKTFDLDTSGTTHEWNEGISIRLPANGGSVVGGVAANPLRIDPTGTTTQPISGSVTANQGGTWTVQQGSAPWSQNITQFGGTNLSTGTGTGGAGIPRVTVSNDSNVLTTQSGTWNLNNISGTISLPTGASTAANQTATQPRNITQFGGTNLSTGTGASGAGIPRVTVANDSNILATQSGSWTVTANAGTNLNTSALALESGGNLATIAAALDSGQETMANSLSVAIASDQSAVPASQSGNWSQRLQDGSGNNITSQVSGTQRALDVGINVAGVQVDPRSGTVSTTQPSAAANGTQETHTVNEFGMILVQEQPSTLTQWGKVFSATSNFVSTGTTAQTALILIRNPNGSGVNCKLKKMTFDGNGGTFRLYSGPTVTANGTAVTSVGNRQTGQATAQCLVTTLPTVTANGSVFKAFTIPAQAFYSEDFQYDRWIEPNNSLLITIAQGSNSGSGSVDMEWAEQ